MRTRPKRQVEGQDRHHIRNVGLIKKEEKRNTSIYSFTPRGPNKPLNKGEERIKRSLGLQPMVETAANSEMRKTIFTTGEKVGKGGCLRTEKVTEE
ncbi:MAG: hypothetical protein ACTSQE_10090, partial [Candidatus Heimdallarchaeaceae archaeon]